MIVVPVECSGAKKGVDLARLVSIESFTEGGSRLVRQQVAIIDEGFEYASGISEEGVTQTGFKPGAQALDPFFGKTLGDSC